MLNIVINEWVHEQVGDALCACYSDDQKPGEDGGHVGLQNETDCEKSKAAQKDSSSAKEVMAGAYEELHADLVELHEEVQIPNDGAGHERRQAVVLRTHNDGGACRRKQSQTLGDLEII